MRNFLKHFSVIIFILLLSILFIFSCAPKKTLEKESLAPSFAVPSKAESAIQVSEWDRVLNSARKEGKLVIYTGLSSSKSGQYAMIKAFNERYGLKIDIDWTMGRANEILAKLFAERRAGLYLADMTITGNTTSVNELKPTGILEDLEPKIILQEVLDTKVYWDGRLPFVDKDRKIWAMSANPTANITINTEYVKEGEIKSFYDLLNPKWKRKIIMDDPTIGGAANAWFVFANSVILGTDYMRQLTKMEPTILRDKRLEIEWLATGKFHIGLGLQATPGVTDFIEAGAPLKLIMPVEGTSLTSSSSNLALFTKAPHPMAARAFINWILTKEGQTIYGETTGYQSAREDVPVTTLDPTRTRQPGVKYFSTISEEYLLLTPQQTEIAREIFGPLVK